MKISIIVPIYNVEDKLNRCVDSILKQSFTDFELLLIDDGSTDNSGNVCDQYKNLDKRVKVIHQQNQGVSKARNNGIENSTGEYLAFVDSDDYIEKDYLRHLLDSIVNSNSQLSICGVKTLFVADGSFMPQANRGDYIVELKKENADEIASLIEERRFNYIYAKLFIKDLIIKNKVLFDQSISLAEDTAFVFEYLKYIDKLSIVGEGYYNYVKYQSGTLSTNGKLNQFELMDNVNNKIEQALISKDLFTGEVKLSIEKRRILSAGYAIANVKDAKGLNKTQKLEKLNQILNNQRLVEALEDNWESKQSLAYAQFIKNRDALSLYKSFGKDKKTCLVKRLIKKLVKR